MVKLHVKRNNKSCFLYETTVDTEIGDLLRDITYIYNQSLRIEAIAIEIEELAKYGASVSKKCEGPIEKEVENLTLQDQKDYEPSLGFVERIDPSGKRSGKAPIEKMAEILLKTAHEAKMRVSEKQVEGGVCLTRALIDDTLDMLRGSLMVAYPEGLPQWDPLYHLLIDPVYNKAVNGTIEEPIAQLWWAGKELLRGKKLSSYVGKNEKTKIVAKLQKRSEGPPLRETALTKAMQRELIEQAYRREEEMKALEDENYLEPSSSDTNALRKSFLGLKDIKWKP